LSPFLGAGRVPVETIDEAVVRAEPAALDEPEAQPFIEPMGASIARQRVDENPPDRGVGLACDPPGRARDG
jgi:hypothetical protein